MKATARTRASDTAGATVAVVSVAAIEPRRLDQQDRDRDRVDEEASSPGKFVLAGGVDHAEQDRGDQGSLETAEAAAGDHQQEEHEIEHREARSEPEQLDREPAAERREPAADREGEREQAVD